jgi:hypothetical protein
MINIKTLSCLVILLLSHYSIAAQYGNTALPAWFFKTENYNRINLAVGISDPNPDTTLSLEQAKINALIVNSLMHGAIFTSLTNVGMGSQQDNNMPSSSLEYIIYTSIIKGKLPHWQSVNVKEQMFTRFKEAMVLLDLSSIDAEQGQIPEFTIIRRAGFQRENNQFPFFVDELEISVSIGDSTILNTIIAKESGRFIDLKKKPENKYYTDPNSAKMAMLYQENSVNSTPAQMPAPTHSGLWKAFIFNLIDQISMFNSLDINFQYKLTSTNTATTGNLSKMYSFQQLVYSLKNVQASKLSNKMDNISMANNNLYLSIRAQMGNKNSLMAKSPDKNEKKRIKKYINEKWSYLGEDDFETGWLKAMNLKLEKEDFLETEIDIQSASLQSGILEGLQLSKLMLSSKLAGKIAALANTTGNNEEMGTVKSAKLINMENTGSIGPVFIFYQNLAPQRFRLKMFVFYNLKQAGLQSNM